MLLWLPKVLKDAGLSVQTAPGWSTATVPGPWGPIKGILCHHTAGSHHGNSPSLLTVIHGRPGLPGPLSNLHLARDGTFTVVAAGRCNHAGKGNWHGVTTGNTSFIGIEAENAGDGSDPWPDVQMEAYAKGCAALIHHIGLPVDMVVGHKEYALPAGRKCDPSFDMWAFRDQVAKCLPK